jgi:uncharacterized membrane protein YfcA
MFTASIIFGALTGMVMGLTGAGGGILAVPALVLGLGLGMPQAMPVALMAVGFAALLGAVDGLRKGLVRYKAGLLMAAAGSVAAPLGVAIAHSVSPEFLTIVFSLVMLLVSARMLRQGFKVDSKQVSTVAYTKPCMLNPETGRLRWTWKSASILTGVGTVSGLLAGMLGVGGGFVIVPAFKQFSNVSMHGVIATSLLIIALVSVSSVISALGAGVAVPTAGWTFIAAAAGGMLAGRRLAPAIPERGLQIGFGLITSLVAALLLSQA